MAGELGTPDSPLDFWGEFAQLTPRQSDPSSPEVGELWLRDDVAPDSGQIATLRFNERGSVIDIPVYSESESVSGGIERFRVRVNGQTGFVPFAPRSEADYAALSLEDGSTYGAHGSLTVDQPTDVEVARWAFEDDTSVSTAVDSWGDNDGTIAGASYTSDAQVGSNALDFDGVDDYVSIPDVFTGREAFSFSAWVKHTGSGGARPRVIGCSNNNVRLTDERNDNQGWIWVVNQAHAVEGSNSYTNGDWVFLCGVYDSAGLGDGDTSKLYRDNATELGGSSGPSGQINPGTKQLGVRPDNAGDHLEGVLDDVRVYSKALTASEVSNLYNTGSI